MLDYPMDKLAAATTDKCLEFAGVTDKKNGTVSLDQLTRFVGTANTIAIFSKIEETNQDKDKDKDVLSEEDWQFNHLLIN